MRKIETVKAFKKGLKQVRKNPKHSDIDNILDAVLTLLVQDIPLGQKYCDHKLSGDRDGFRDCHIKPDLVLIYRKIDKVNDDGDDILQLAEIGSHGELGL